ncbi:MAG TPA: helix-turn-helix domain-containing protein [Firmicutes bacterium]|jgi:DNA-binding MarR family transcriptional regulator|nr:helix-turn-helix domain-containing protein [Bacillota bacterium]
MNKVGRVIQIDRVIHEPVRLAIMSSLYEKEFADFNGLLEEFSLTRGNLASHIKRLEQAKYVEVIKTFKDRIPHTTYALTNKGRKAYENYWHLFDEIRQNIVLGG